MAVNHLDDVEMRSRIVEFSKFADLGIEDIEKSDNHILSRHLQYDTNGAIQICHQPLLPVVGFHHHVCLYRRWLFTLLLPADCVTKSTIGEIKHAAQRYKDAADDAYGANGETNHRGDHTATSNGSYHQT